MSTLSLHSYHRALRLRRADEPFYALIAAALMKADGDNHARLKLVFPECHADLLARHQSPLGLGVLQADGPVDMGLLQKQLSLGGR